MRPSVEVGAFQRNLSPSAVRRATKLVGASTEDTAAPDDALSEGVAVSAADSDAVAVAVSAGAAASSLPDDLDQTTSARRTIPTITAVTTRFEAPCFGLGATGVVDAARGAGAVETLTRLRELRSSGTGGTTTRDAEDLRAEDFLTAFLAVFFAADFLTAFFAVVLRATVFFAVDFLAEDLRATDFLATFLAADFFAGDFFAVFFFTATWTPWITVDK